MLRFDTVVKNGMIVDGTRSPRYREAISGIEDGRITEIGQLGASKSANRDRRFQPDCRARIYRPAHALRRAKISGIPTALDFGMAWRDLCHDRQLRVRLCPGAAGGARARDVDDDSREAIPHASMKAGLRHGIGSLIRSFSTAWSAKPKAVNLLPCVPLGPLITWVIGSPEEAKHRAPTVMEEREIVRLFGEAMDAGGWGWSAQRLHPDGPVCLQRDYDGTPMVTDVMGDETCRNPGPQEAPVQAQFGFHANVDGRRGSLSRSERSSRDARRTEPAVRCFSGRWSHSIANPKSIDF